jgi:AAHS family 4-hydroxybenzoate transporter-like MFS transporter
VQGRAFAGLRVDSCLESHVILMRAIQVLIILICFLCNMLDGMDVLIISYTAPAIAKAWSISPANLGIVFSSGLVGMTVGAIFLAPMADHFGRKPLMVLAALIMGSCIYLTSFATDINVLMIYRFISGLGIGTMMASTAAITAEYAPFSTRDFWVSTVVAGYPVGAVLTGISSAKIIAESGWEHLFQLAGIATFLVVPILLFLLKESDEFKAKAKPEDAKLSALFTSEFKWSTWQLWSALFLSFTTLYFLMNWIPKLATNAGLSMELAIYSGTIFNLGAIVGIPVQGYFSSRFGLKKSIGTLLLITAVLLGIFGLFSGSNLILVVLFFLGFGVQGSFVGLYAVAARMYPTAFRSTGVGWAIGMGRLGGIIGPVLGGLLVGLGFGMAQSFIFFALPSFIAGLITLKISAKTIS